MNRNGKTKHNQVTFQHEAMTGFLSVIIPVYHDTWGLERTLRALRKSSLKPQAYEIIVANDGGATEITAICDKYRAKCIDIIPQGGSYTARDKALELSRGEYIAFTDADVLPDPNWLKEGLHQLQECDYVGGKTVIDERLIRTLADDYEFATAFAVNDRHELQAQTVNVMVRRSVIEEVGGFDRRLFSGGDMGFGSRVCRNRKHRRRYCDRLLVVHPPRGHKAMLKKFRRVGKGIYMLCQYYPARFRMEHPVLDMMQELRFSRIREIVRKMTHTHKYGLLRYPYVLYMVFYSRVCLIVKWRI